MQTERTSDVDWEAVLAGNGNAETVESPELIEARATIAGLVKAVKGLMGLLVFNGDTDDDLVRRFGVRSFHVIKDAREAVKKAA